MSPISVEHNYEHPIGKVEFEGNKAIFKFMEDSNIKADHLVRICPSYVITKQDDKGNVLECELLGFGIELGNK